MKYTLNEFLKLTNGKSSDDFDGEKIINFVLSDSRKIEGNGNLFVALTGDRFDGHEFVSKITSDGENFAIIENENYMAKNTILVNDVRSSLYRVAMMHREDVLKDIKYVAITGSVGKTSTKEYVNAVISQKYNTFKSPGNQNSYTGLPMVVLNCPVSTEYAVLELGMNMRGEIKKLSNLVKPDIGVITNIGWSHSEYLGGRDNIFAEKLDIVSGMRSGILVVDGDDDYLSKDLSIKQKVIRCSIKNKNADFYAEKIRIEDGKTFFTVNGKEIYVRQNGVHNVKNALLAYAVGILLGENEDEIAHGLSSVPENASRIKMRLGRDGSIVIDDCYNAAPSSMKAALDVLKTQKGVKIAVLGDMLELGEHTKTLHEEVGEYAAKCCDILICFGNYGADIANGALKCGHKNVKVFNMTEREQLINTVDSLVDTDSAFLFKASNRMRFGEVISAVNL